jgi:hypothetical protein
MSPGPPALCRGGTPPASRKTSSLARGSANASLLESAGVFQNVHAGAGAVDEVEAAVLIRADVV